jgi:hypothetical protein
MPTLSTITLAAKPDLTRSATEQRQHDPDFAQRCAINALAERLPLRWPTPPEVPPSPKPRYRSRYQPPEPARVQQLDLAAWESIGLFDLVLLLVDFSGLRPILAQKLYRVSARGWVPFDPVSCFLLFGWQRLNRWQRLETLRKLADPRNADYARAFGFAPGVYPSESGYRYFLTVLGQKTLDDLIRQSMALVQASGVLPTEALAHAIVSFDGQIHDAASRLHCHDVCQSCYQPTTADQPRPCPAKEDGKRGCDCDTMECRAACRRATPWDPQARYVWYRADNRGQDAAANTPTRPSTPPTTPSAPSPPSAASPPRGKGTTATEASPVA